VNDREALQERLKQAGIPTAVHYPIPLNKQPAVSDAVAKLPVGDLIADQVMSLPMSAGLSMVDQAVIVENLNWKPYL
jgi:UDP-2-acetamido-2-deoxy-ribo-hexuluronate aminotransferase